MPETILSQGSRDRLAADLAWALARHSAWVVTGGRPPHGFLIESDERYRRP
jgi:hypothetical protein